MKFLSIRLLHVMIVRTLLLGSVVYAQEWSRTPDTVESTATRKSDGGAPVKNLSHSASFSRSEKYAPSKVGTIHLGSIDI
jgi:hypothetical protein